MSSCRVSCRVVEARAQIHIVFFMILYLIIAAPQVTNFVPFSGCLLYGYANPIQADDGSDRGPAQGLFRWAKALAGSGDRQRRASSARDPPTLPRRVLTVLGLTRARQPCRSGPALWQGRLRALLIARRTPPRAILCSYLTFSRMRARALHRCLQAT